MRRTTVYLQEAPRLRLRAVAAAQGRPVAAVLREALILYLDQQDRPRPTSVGDSQDGGVAHCLDDALNELRFGLAG